MISDKAFLDGESDEYDFEPEAISRMKNLMWTVSDDYTLDTKPDLSHFSENKYVAMFDAVKQGAFARYFEQNEFALYIVRKIYYGADQTQLTALGQMCLDCAVYPFIVKERPGVRRIREQAYEYLLEMYFHALSQNQTGRLRLALLRGQLRDDWLCGGNLQRSLDKMHALENLKLQNLTAGEMTYRIIAVLDDLYNTLIDPHFAKQHGDLDRILSVSVEEMKEFGWQDLLDEDAQDAMNKLMEQVSTQVMTSEMMQQPDDEDKKQRHGKRVIMVDEKAAAKMHDYIEVNFGRSYLSDREQQLLTQRICRGAHADCSLYYTDGIIHSKVLVNAQYVNAVKQAKSNYRLYLNSKHMVRRSVEIMAAYLKRSLQLRNETDYIRADSGEIVPAALWKIGRKPVPDRLFRKIEHHNSSDFAIEVLIDASGSQRERQGQVALQAYIISCALSEAGVPHRIMSYCTFWDYTVLQRFRDFDDPADKDIDVLEFTTSSNNRDGLAIRAAGDELLARPEENKILIVLSDGKPNDVVLNRPGSRNPKPYFGDYGVNDTAYEIRKLRGTGMYILGVFTGKESDLQAEKKIFGKDFVYIHDIRNFSKAVSTYLTRLLDTDCGEM